MAISVISRSSGFKSPTNKIVTNKPSIQKSLPLKAGKFKLNGTELAISSADNLTKIIRKINAKTGRTGIKAEISKNSSSSHQLILKSKKTKVVIQDTDGVFERLKQHNKIGVDDNAFVKLQRSSKLGRIEFIYELGNTPKRDSDVLKVYLEGLLNRNLSNIRNDVIDFSKQNLVGPKPEDIPDIELLVDVVDDPQIAENPLALVAEEAPIIEVNPIVPEEIEEVVEIDESPVEDVPEILAEIPVADEEVSVEVSEDIQDNVIEEPIEVPLEDDIVENPTAEEVFEDIQDGRIEEAPVVEVPIEEEIPAEYVPEETSVSEEGGTGVIDSTVIFEDNVPQSNDYLEDPLYATGSEPVLYTPLKSGYKATAPKSINIQEIPLDSRNSVASEPFSPQPIELSQYIGTGVEDLMSPSSNIKDLEVAAEQLNGSFDPEIMEPLTSNQTKAIKEVIDQDSPGFSPITREEEPELFKDYSFSNSPLNQLNHSSKPTNFGLLSPRKLSEKLKSGFINVPKYNPLAGSLTQLDEMRQKIADERNEKLKGISSHNQDDVQLDEGKQEAVETTPANLSKIDNGNDPLNSSQEIRKILQKIKDQEEKLDYGNVVRQFINLGNSKKPEENKLRRDKLIAIKNFVEGRIGSLQSKDPELYTIFAKHYTKVQHNDKQLFDKNLKGSIDTVAAYIRAYWVVSSDKVHVKPFVNKPPSVK